MGSPCVRDMCSRCYLFLVFDCFCALECSLNFLEVYRSNTAITERLKKLCGLTATSILVHSNVAIVRIYLKAKTLSTTKIHAVYSVFVGSKHIISCRVAALPHVLLV